MIEDRVVHYECHAYTRVDRAEDGSNIGKGGEFEGMLLCDGCRHPIRGLEQDFVSLEWRARS